ncbi:hypothetical protein Tco_0015847 [Tanacetum coccineum]
MCLTPHMNKIAKITDTPQSLIPSSEEPAEDSEATVDAPTSLETSESAAKVESQPETVTIEKEPESQTDANAGIQSIGSQLNSTLNEVLPCLVVNSLDERLPEMISDNLSLKLTSLIVDNIKHKMPNLIKKSLNSNVSNLLNVLNKLETQGFLSKIMHSTIVVHEDLLSTIITAKNLTSNINKTSGNMAELVDLLTQYIYNNIPSSLPFSVAAEGVELTKYDNHKSLFITDSDDEKDQSATHALEIPASD